MPELSRDLFEIISTTRSMRRLKPDPVPPELIRKILEAGTAAPSGGNMQRWRFLVVTDPKVKQTVGTYYKRAWAEVVCPRYTAGDPAPGTSPERFRRMLDAAQYLADHIHEAPVWIVPCMAGANPSRTAGSSIYPAVQNMLLAARALGLGATLTTLYLTFEKEVESILGLPADVHSYALLPIGYPDRSVRAGSASATCRSRLSKPMGSTVSAVNLVPDRRDIMRLPQIGGCQCGKVRYAITEKPQLVYTCHCTACQRLTGSAFSMGLVVAETAFRLSGVDPKPLHRVADSGRVNTRLVCPECGSWICGLPRDGMVRARAGSLDDTSWLRPTRHIWTRSKQPWVTFSPSDEIFEGQPPA